MKRIFALAVGAACVMAATPSVRADDADDNALIPESAFPGKWSANVALTSEYIFRGISQTDDTPAIQGGFDWNLESVAGTGVGIYAGVWASNVNFHTDNSLESDWYAGLQGSIGPKDMAVNWKLGGIYYYYPGVINDANNNKQHQDYAEVALSLNHDFGPAALTLMYNYSPDFFASTGTAHYVAAKLDIPIWKFTLSPIAGRQWIKENTQFGAPDYWHYGAGLTATIVGFATTLAVSDTDIKRSECAPIATSNDVCGPQVTVTVSRSF
jgi:uncharacterized protein (TIGR02001 family)